MSFAVRTRESEGENEGMQEPTAANSDSSEEITEPLAAPDRDGLHDGMLLRDVLERTTFYDPVAERQMTQTDAKLFYQRSKRDLRVNSASWSQSTPHESPIIVSGSHPATDYGADSLILDQDGGELLICHFIDHKY